MRKQRVDKIKDKYIQLPVQVKASLWFLVSSVLQKGISVIATPVFTRLMTTTEYGQYSVFNSWLSIVTVFVSLRMYNAVYTQGLVKFEEERKIFSSSLQGLSLVLVIFWTIIYLFTRSFWNNMFGLTTIQMLAMMSLIWTTSVYNYWAVEQRVNYTYKKLVILTLLVSFAKPIVGVFLVAIASDKATARIVGLMLVELIAYTGLFLVQLKRGNTFFSKKFWKYSFLFCFPLIPHYLSQTILNAADKIMIQKFIGLSEAGIYSLAYSLSQLMLMVNQALLQTISPWIYQKIKNNQFSEIQNVTMSAMAVIGALNILLILFAPEIVSIFAPSTYANAIWIIPPVALSGYFTFSYSIFCTFEFYYEKKSYIVMATSISAALNIVLNYFFINIFGYYAAGYTTLVCYMIYTLGHFVIMNKIIKHEVGNIRVYDNKKLLVMTTTFLTIGLLILTTYNHIVLRYSVVFLLILILVVFKRQVWEIINKIISSKNRKV